MRILKSNFTNTLVVSLIILFLVCVGIYHSSCQITSEGIVLLNPEEQSPKIVDFSFDEEKIIVNFTKKINILDSFVAEVNLENNSFLDFSNTNDKISVDIENTSNEKKIQFVVNGKTEIGKKYGLYCLCEDFYGNSISFTIPFYGYNKNIPKIFISEISDYYSSKDGSVEYVELYAATSGNLFGLELITANDKKVFPLPCIDVNKGEYIVVHLRTVDKINSITEYETNLNLSKAKDSVNDRRDIWFDSEESALSPSADIVILNNHQKSAFLDCVMYSKQEYALENNSWKNENLLEYSKKCIEQKVWNTEGLPSDSVYSMDRKSINYISRKNISTLNSEESIKNDSSVWIGTTKTNRTPGYENKW